MKLFKNKRFCDINPTCYAIALRKENLKRHVRNFFDREKLADTKSIEKLPNTVSAHDSVIVKTGLGIDPVLQENKAVNIALAGEKINGTVVRPGEVFSFWHTVGPITRRRGYRDGRVIVKNKLVADIGGGLCNLSNTLHLLILHSPMDVVEFHNHSDALAPDNGHRVPFSAGTSVSYNSVDYRFKNNTDQNVQICIWVADGKLFGELRSEREYPLGYELFEEDHHFAKEGDKYYRNSKIYRRVTDRATGEKLRDELILDNHSEVLFDYSLIPQDQIRPASRRGHVSADR